MSTYWYRIEVFNFDKFLGSFYIDTSKPNKVIDEINNKYGKDKWTQYYIE